MEDQWIIRTNIARYRRLLGAELDNGKRSILKQLLAECTAQLQPKGLSAFTISGELARERGADTAVCRECVPNASSFLIARSDREARHRSDRAG